MRLIFLILFSIASFVCIAQDDKLPTQKQLEAQKQEAIKDIKEQIAELKKQITESKANKENPEDIKALEQQLAGLEQMATILGKDFYKGKPEIITADPPQTTVPKYISPIVPIVLKQQVLPPSEAQAKDELLWYKGKKINETTIITTQNTIVQYNRKKNMVIIQADKKKDTTALRIAANLAKCRQWTTQYVDQLASEKNIFFEYPEIMMHLNEFDFLEETYRNIIKNTIDLPIPENMIAYITSPEIKNSGPSVDDYMSPDDLLKKLHNNMLELIKNAPPETFPQSPNRRLWDICTTCNEKEFEVYQKDMKAWQNDFTKYEESVLENMAAIVVWMAKQSISYANSGISTLENDLKEAIDFAFERWDRKLNYLETEYSESGPGNLDVVIENLLLIQNQKKKYYGAVDERYTFRIKNILIDYQKRITDRYELDMRYKTYFSVLNTRLIQAYDRHYKLNFGTSSLGGTSTSSPLQNLLDKIKKFNRFSLTVDIDFDFEMKDEVAKIIGADGKLSSNGNIYVSLGKASGCKWQLYLTNTDYTDLSITNEHSFRIPMEVNSGTKFTYYRNPVRAVMAEYKGPKDMLLVFPYVSIDFCRLRGFPSGINTNIINDTIILESLRYKQEDLSKYEPGPQQYSVDLLQYVNKMFLSVEKIAEDYKDLLMSANEMMMVALTGGMVNKSTGFRKLDRIQIDFKKNGETRLQQKSLSLKTHFGNTVLLFKADNLPELVNVTRTLSNTEFLGGYNLKSGNITIKIIHDPQ